MKNILFFLIFSLFYTPVSTIGSLATPVELVVTDFTCRDSSGEIRQHNSEGLDVKLCKIGDRVEVAIGNLQVWLKENSEKPLSKVALALDGYQLVGIPSAVTSNGLNFELVRQPDKENNMKAWRTLLARTKLFEPAKMTMSIAIKDTSKVYGTQEMGIIVASSFRFWTFATLFVCLIASFIWLVANRGLLRDVGPKPVAGEKPFSLGFTQMALWTFLVLGGFAYIWLVMGDLAVITPGVLGFMGISAGTGLVAASIATSKQGSGPAELPELESKRQDLQNQVKDLKAKLALDPPPVDRERFDVELKQKASSLAAVEQQIADITMPATSKGFFTDLLSSGGEIALPRFQMMAWTLVLGMVFGYSVFTTLTMPEFNATLLGLMAISSGTYVGFKVPTKTGK